MKKHLFALIPLLLAAFCVRADDDVVTFKVPLRMAVEDAFYEAFRYPTEVLDKSPEGVKRKKSRDAWRNVIEYDYGEEFTEGRVTVLYSVYRFGRISRPVVVKGLCPEIDKAVKKAMKQVCQRVTVDTRYNDAEYIQTFWISPDGSVKTRVQADETVLMRPEEPSMPQGGKEGLVDFVAKNQRYPDRAREAGMQGTVETQFIIDEEGYVLAGCVYSSESADLDCAALKVVASIPQMTPACHHGVPVKSYWTWPIVYRLSR